MIKYSAIDFTSVNVVQVELLKTIKTASHHFESFIHDKSDMSQLQEALHQLQSIVGVLKIIDIPGADTLTAEMVGLMSEFIAGELSINDRKLSALSHAFVGLPCYIEYVVEKQQALPWLVMNFVNELRIIRKIHLLEESSFFDFTIQALESSADANSAELDQPLVKRQRQLLLIGLVGLLRE